MCRCKSRAIIPVRWLLWEVLHCIVYKKNRVLGTEQSKLYNGDIIEILSLLCIDHTFGGSYIIRFTFWSLPCAIVEISVRMKLDVRRSLTYRCEFFFFVYELQLKVPSFKVQLEKRILYFHRNMTLPFPLSCKREPGFLIKGSSFLRSFITLQYRFERKIVL